MYIFITASLYCTAETDSIIINYMPVKLLIKNNSPERIVKVYAQLASFQLFQATRFFNNGLFLQGSKTLLYFGVKPPMHFSLIKINFEKFRFHELQSNRERCRVLVAQL